MFTGIHRSSSVQRLSAWILIQALAFTQIFPPFAFSQEKPDSMRVQAARQSSAQAGLEESMVTQPARGFASKVVPETPVAKREVGRFVAETVSKITHAGIEEAADLVAGRLQVLVERLTMVGTPAPVVFQGMNFWMFQEYPGGELSVAAQIPDGRWTVPIARNRFNNEDQLPNLALWDLRGALLRSGLFPPDAQARRKVDWVSGIPAELEVRIQRADLPNKEAVAREIGEIPHSYLSYSLVEPQSGTELVSLMFGFSPAGVNPEDLILVDVTMDKRFGHTGLDLQFLSWVLTHTIDPSMTRLRLRHWKFPGNNELYQRIMALGEGILASRGREFFQLPADSRDRHFDELDDYSLPTYDILLPRLPLADPFSPVRLPEGELPARQIRMTLASPPQQSYWEHLLAKNAGIEEGDVDVDLSIGATKVGVGIVPSARASASGEISTEQFTWGELRALYPRMGGADPESKPLDWSLQTMVQLIQTMLSALYIPRGHLRRIGISFGGLVQNGERITVQNVKIQGFEQPVPLKEIWTPMVRAAFGRDIQIEIRSDDNSSVIGEHHFLDGALRDVQDGMTLTLATGDSIGILQNEKPIDSLPGKVDAPWLGEIGWCLMRDPDGFWTYRAPEGRAPPQPRSGEVRFEQRFGGPWLAARFIQTLRDTGFSDGKINGIFRAKVTEGLAMDDYPFVQQMTQPDEKKQLIVLVGITSTALHEDSLIHFVAKRFLEEMGVEIGQALRTYLHTFADQPFTQGPIVLVGSIGEEFGRGFTLEGEEVDLLLPAIREGLGSDRVVRSEMHFEREFASFPLALTPQRLQDLQVGGVPVRSLLRQIPVELDPWLDRPVRIGGWISDLDFTLRIPDGSPLPESIRRLIGESLTKTQAYWRIITGSAVGEQGPDGRPTTTEVGRGVLEPLRDEMLERQDPAALTRLNFFGAGGQQRVRFDSLGNMQMHGISGQVFTPDQQLLTLKSWLRVFAARYPTPPSEQARNQAQQAVEAAATPEELEQLTLRMMQEWQIPRLGILRRGVIPETGILDPSHPGMITLTFPITEDQTFTAIAREMAETFDREVRPHLPAGLKPTIWSTDFVTVTFFSKDDQVLEEVAPVLRGLPKEGVVAVMLGDHPGADTFFLLTSGELGLPVLKFLVDPEIEASPELLRSGERYVKGSRRTIEMLLDAQQTNRTYRQTPLFYGQLSIEEVERKVEWQTGYRYRWEDLRRAVQTAGLEELPVTLTGVNPASAVTRTVTDLRVQKMRLGSETTMVSGLGAIAGPHVEGLAYGVALSAIRISTPEGQAPLPVAFIVMSEEEAVLARELAPSGTIFQVGTPEYPTPEVAVREAERFLAGMGVLEPLKLGTDDKPVRREIQELLKNTFKIHVGPELIQIWRDFIRDASFAFQA